MASSLIHKATYEADNSLDSSLREAFQLLEPQLRPPFPLTIPAEAEYLNLNRAILYGILSETHLTKVHIKHLHGIIIDGYRFFTNLLCRLVDELYSKLVENVKLQLLYVTSEMIHVSAIGIDSLLVALLRQIRGGDFTEANLWLCSEMVNLFMGKWEFLLEEQPLVLSSALDVIRLLQDLVHVPEFQDIWKDLLLLTDVSQFYQSRTCSRYFLLRITPEMESHLRFLFTQVKLGSQTRYQIWFGRKFLNVPEKETVVINVIRFISCAHHPSNDIIHSNVIPRWAVIGWLLNCCTKNHVEANVKLALFYDWLFFKEDVDNIMNIEPAILLMVNSMPKYLHMTQNLLEFLFLVVDHYDIERKDLILKGVLSALDILDRKGVVQSFDVLTTCDMLSPFLRNL
ncbi:hypothetical protein L1987_33507 [Smallanthus sonchifolius]|uniref:Uncharacterized protein n=1 Tax=Smallanthus sonchifolius TaxID=185202 RepID=A0ACB9HSN6_9ASTR|nr:hypothetical protein L1987_33507 [Smallanthus sonchifolius]